jgi:hypothetical protein
VVVEASNAVRSTWWDEAVQARDGASPALFVEPAGGRGWLDEIGEAVLTGRLSITRTVITSATADELIGWARSAAVVLPNRVRTPLVEELRELSRVVCELGNVARLTLRAFTEPATRRCGFHVDTVPPQAPPVGVLRVYNGACTEYVEPHPASLP